MIYLREARKKKLKRQPNENIRDFYMNAYPTDEFGSEIDPEITFYDLYDVMSEGEDVYNWIGVHDSVIRERVFERLAEIMGIDYGDVYNQFIMSSGYKKGLITFSELPFSKFQ